MHRNPEFWPQPDTFLPERWLVAAGDTLAPAKGSWRPFEYGPRNCSGQELAIIEMKIVLVMALQAFDFEAAGSADTDCGSEDGEWGTSLSGATRAA